MDEKRQQNGSETGNEKGRAKAVSDREVGVDKSNGIKMADAKVSI